MLKISIYMFRHSTDVIFGQIPEEILCICCVYNPVHVRLVV